jgi:hypothetical protein
LWREARQQIASRVTTAPVEDPKKRSGETEGQHVPTADHGNGRPAARGRYAALQAIRTTVAKVSRKFSRAAADATEPEDYEDAPVMDWWQQQQLFGWNDFNNDDGFDFGGGDFGSTGPPDFPAPHL